MARPPVMYDLSVPVRAGTPEWPGDTPFSCGWTMRLAEGGSVNLSRFEMSPHVGTHADAPVHVLDDGDSSGAFPLDVFRGPAQVVDVPEALRAAASQTTGGVEFDAIASLLPERIERLLLRTGATVATGGFPETWACLTADCVAKLCDRGLRLLGVDAPSVDPRHSKSLEAHKALFSRGAFNLENLDLRAVPAGAYELTAYPIRLDGLDAAPVRAVLVGRTD